MKKGRYIGQYRLNDCGRRYLVKCYEYKGETYAVFIDIDHGSDTKSQHRFAQSEIESLRQ